MDLISDTLTRIRNAQQVKLAYVDCNLSNTITSILKVLQEEGYIHSYDVNTFKNPAKNKVRVKLKYYNYRPVILIIKRVSKPGVRMFTKIKNLQSYQNGLGIYILSTSGGIMSDREARKRNLGGEVICQVF